MKTLKKKYASLLADVRQHTLQARLILKFSEDRLTNETNALNRLRLSVALLNDLHLPDLNLVRFLFTENIKAQQHRRRPDTLLPNLQLSGWLLASFKKPEDVWLFLEANRVEKSFDIEFTLSAGVENVFAYLHKSRNSKKAILLRKIGESSDQCRFSRSHLRSWKQGQKDSVSFYKFPLTDELHFAGLMDEPDHIKKILPAWVKQQTTWTKDAAAQYIGFSQYVGDTLAETQALEIYTTEFDDLVTFSFKIKLAELYVKHDRFEESLTTLTALLNCSPNRRETATIIRLLVKLVRRLKATQHELEGKAQCVLAGCRESHAELPDMVVQQIDRLLL